VDCRLKAFADRTRKLSRRQRRVVELVARDERPEIAALGIGAHVVRNYVSAIYDKIGLSRRVELAPEEDPASMKNRQ
jgi:DNA-binding CsgD family transcriptional regulator